VVPCTSVTSYSLDYLEREPRQPSQQAGDNPPLIFLIHGRAAEAKTIFSIEGLLDPTFHVIAISAPFKSALGGLEWFRPPEPIPGEVRDAQQFEEAERMLTADVEAHIARVGAKKVFLWGFSQGAAMAVILGLRGLVKPRGAIPMCGFLPTGVKTWSAWDVSPRFLVYHATEDEVLPTQRSKDLADFIRSKGGEAQYEEYKGRHKMTLDSIRFVNGWILSEP
jgi:phospholipase/carboxylesterase